MPQNSFAPTENISSPKKVSQFKRTIWSVLDDLHAKVHPDNVGSSHFDDYAGAFSSKRLTLSAGSFPDKGYGNRPYSPLRLQARLAEVAALCPPIAPSAFDQVSNFIREAIPDPAERSRVLSFLAGTNDIRAASFRVLCAMHRWLNFDDISKPSGISLQELSAVRSHLTTRSHF